MKLALITGGGRGIGLGISQILSEDGINLVICGTRPEKDLSQRISELSASGIEVVYIQCDITDKKARSRMLSVVDEKFGKLDFLINNAGIAPPERKDILEAGEDSFDKVLAVNLKAPYFLSQEVSNYMISKSIKGSIINITSVSSELASVNRGEYCISKAGLSMMTKLFATRLAEYGINVFEIMPGIIKTDMTRSVTEKYDEMIATGLTLTKRWGLPEDVGKAVSAICRGDFPYSSGSVFMVDGGLTVGRL